MQAICRDLRFGLLSDRLLAPIVVDFNAFKLTIGASRAAEIGLTNFYTLAADVAEFEAPRHGGKFAIGIALHACGSATDLALAACAKVGASFICSPCCVGKVGEYKPGSLKEGMRICDGRVSGIQMPRSELLGDVLNAQEYLSLAGAADYHSKDAPSPLRQAAKSYIELDRLATMAEASYRVRMGKLPRDARSPKDDVIWGWAEPPTGDSESKMRDTELCSRWLRSEVCESLVRGGLWLHEAHEAELPSEHSLLSPAADEAALERTIRVVRQVAAARDRGDGWRAGRVMADAPQRSGFDDKERAKWKALRRQAWSTKGKIEQGEMVELQSSATSLQSGPSHNAKADRKLVQELAYASCVSTYTGSASGAVDTTSVSTSLRSAQHMWLAPPPYWPLIWNGHAIQLAGPAVDQAVAAAASLVPLARRRGLTARRVQLGHRMSIVSEAELQELRESSGRDAASVLAEASATLTDALESLKAVAGATVASDLTAKPSALSVEDVAMTPDLAVCGAVRRKAPTVLYSVELLWPAAQVWRAKLGLIDTSGFTVELGV